MSLIKNFINEISTYGDSFIDQPILYHFTHIDELDSILSRGLLTSMKKKNLAYKDQCDGISLTVKSYTGDVNLADHLFSEYEDSFNSDGSLQYPTIIRLSIDSSKLKTDFIDADEDYMQLYKDKDAYKSYIMGSICYTDDIRPNDILKAEVEYEYHKYKQVKDVDHAYDVFEKMNN